MNGHVRRAVELLAQWIERRALQRAPVLPAALVGPERAHALAVEPPELIAERLCRFADIVGRERVIAGSDCGFGTFAGYGKLDPDISFKKLRAMAEGAAIASKRLWGRA